MCRHRCSVGSYRTMVDCWQYLPHDRPTFTELVARLETSLSQVAAAVSYRLRILSPSEVAVAICVYSFYIL